MAVRKTIGDKVVLCQASDISTDGIFLASVHDEPCPIQARCLLEFTLPGSRVTIAARGRVVRQDVNGRYALTAVRFAAIAPSHRRLIQRYVRAPAAVPAAPPIFLTPARA